MDQELWLKKVGFRFVQAPQLLLWASVSLDRFRSRVHWKRES